jgi:tetratricopeptide (TPR) repeat protein
VHAIAPAARRAGLPRLEEDRLNLDGMLRFETGDVGGAEAVWRDLLDQASRAEQHEFVARANNNLGIVFTLQVRPVEAVTAYERAVAAYRLLGLRRGIAQAHQNLGITYRELGHANEAEEHFDAALRYARDDASEDEIARIEQERALLIYLARRDTRLARATAIRALRRFATLADPVGFGDCLRVLAMIDLGSGDYAAARSHADHALEHARAAGHQLLEAEVLEVLAGVDLAEAREDDAANARERAKIRFEQLGAGAWGSAFRERIGELISAARYA